MRYFIAREFVSLHRFSWLSLIAQNE